MSVPIWLIDKSALARLGTSSDVDEWAHRIERGVVHISTVTLLEIGYSARTAEAMAQSLRRAPLAAMPIDHSTPAIEDRAREVQPLLADLTGQPVERLKLEA